MNRALIIPLLLVLLQANCGGSTAGASPVIKDSKGGQTSVSDLGISFIKIWKAGGAYYASGPYVQAGSGPLSDWTVIKVDANAQPGQELVLRDSDGSALALAAVSSMELLANTTTLKWVRINAETLKVSGQMGLPAGMENCTVTTIRHTGGYWIMIAPCADESQKTILLPIRGGATTVLPESCLGSIMGSKLFCAGASATKGMVKIGSYTVPGFAHNMATDEIALEDVRAALSLTGGTVLLASRTELVEIDTSLKELQRRDLANQIGYIRAVTAVGNRIWVSGKNKTLLLATDNLSTIASAPFVAIGLRPFEANPEQALAAFGSGGVQRLEARSGKIESVRGYRRMWHDNALGQPVLSVNSW